MAQCALLLINSRKIPVWGLYRIVEVEMEEMYILVFFAVKFKQEESAKNEEKKSYDKMLIDWV